MHPDSLDYVEGHSYQTEIKSEEEFGPLEVEHQVSENNLVASYLREGKAVFATEVSSPYSTHRKIYKHQWEGGAPALRISQKIELDRDWLVSPVYYRPLVIVRDDLNREELNLETSHGVHELWHDRTVLILPGTILASAGFWNAKDYKSSIIKLTSDEKMHSGTMKVKTSPDDGFYFIVTVSTDVYKSIRSSDSDHKRTILTFALSACLSIIQREYQQEGGEGEEGDGDRDWRSYPALRALHREIERQGLPAWDNEQEFSPELVATRMRPIKVSVSEDD